MNKTIDLFCSNRRRSSYILDAIENGFISFPRIRFGGGPEAQKVGPGGQFDSFLSLLV